MGPSTLNDSIANVVCGYLLQGLEALCKAVKDAITSPDYGATIIQPYLQ